MRQISRIKKYDFVILSFETLKGLEEKRFENCSVGKAIKMLLQSTENQLILRKVNTSESHLFVSEQKIKNRCNNYEGLIDGMPGARRLNQSDGWERRDTFFASEKELFLNSKK